MLAPQTISPADAPCTPHRYLLFASHSYAYSILRPLQRAIRQRGDEAAWFLEDTCEDLLTADEQRLRTDKEVRAGKPRAVFAPGNWTRATFPGIQVEVFHGYPINKRNDKVDDHFRLRGWFDLYCTQGPTSTGPFMQLAERHGYFKVYETGWTKMDDTFSPRIQRGDRHGEVPTILVASTFSKHISALALFYPLIRRLAHTRNWHWIVTMHPRLLADEALCRQYRELDEACANVTFRPVFNSAEEMCQTDVMLCDTSSIILEYMMLDKPVVTYRNMWPGDYLLDVQELDEIEPALERALQRPADLMRNLDAWTRMYESHRDGHNSERVLDAVDDFERNYQGRLKRKPLNLWRKLQALLSLPQ